MAKDITELTFNRAELEILQEVINYARYHLADQKAAAPTAEAKLIYNDVMRRHAGVAYRVAVLLGDGEVTPPGAVEDA